MKTKIPLDNLASLIANPPVSESIAFTGWLMKDGRVVYSTNTACHAGLGYPSSYNVTQPEWVWSKMINNAKTVPKKHRDLFINYMLKESPWSSVFENETVDEVLTYGWLISADVDAHLLVNAMVATRLVTEFSTSRFAVFINFVEAGMDKNMAMILSMFCSDSDNKNFYISSCMGHGFAYDVSTNIIKNFVNNTPYLTRGSYKNVLGYSSHCNVWDARSGDRYGNSGQTSAVLDKIPVYKNVEKINLNIFYKEKRTGHYTYHSYETAKYFETKVKELLVA